MPRSRIAELREHSLWGGVLVPWVALCLLQSGGLAEAKEKFTIFDAELPYTMPAGINDSGVIVGTTDQSGFLRAADGTITTFTLGDKAYILSLGINDAGVVAGYYQDPEVNLYGFERAIDGTITIINVEGASTTIHGINASGTITGGYAVDTYHAAGFVQTADGTTTTFQISNESTAGQAINDRGVITGWYGEANRGFERTAGGHIRKFDAPGAGKGVDQGTLPVAINRAGAITGSYIDSGYVEHGFVRAADGTVTAFDPSGSVATYPYSINAKGVIAGSYVDAFQVSHGFVRTGDGKIKSFDPPGSVGTYSYGINSQGSITGYFEDNEGDFHGFLRSP